MSEIVPDGDFPPSPSSKKSSLLTQHLNERFTSSKITLEWHDIRYTMVEPNAQASSRFSTVYRKRHILKGIHGYAQSGQLLAIMGPSGCGKTTLLNILAARCPSGGKDFFRTSGSISVNGQKRDETAFRRLSSYVVQDDNLFPHLTVHETFLLAANFFLPATSTAGDKTQVITAVMAELGLNKARDTIIGDDRLRGVSGKSVDRMGIVHAHGKCYCL